MVSINDSDIKILRRRVLEIYKPKCLCQSRLNTFYSSMYCLPTNTKRIQPYKIFKCKKEAAKIYNNNIPNHTLSLKKHYSLLLDKTKNIWDVPYFLGNLTRNEAEMIINEKKENSFLLRLSNSREHLLTVTIKIENIITHFFIKEYLLIVNHSSDSCNQHESLVL